jgi:phosphomannomutase
MVKLAVGEVLDALEVLVCGGGITSEGAAVVEIEWFRTSMFAFSVVHTKELFGIYVTGSPL